VSGNSCTGRKTVILRSRICSGGHLLDLDDASSCMSGVGVSAVGE